MTTLTRRRGIVLAALVGLFVSTYLYLYSIGFYGELACGASGGCSVVQASQYAYFMGFSVAGWGLGWYLAVLAVAVLAVSGRRGDARWVSIALVALSTGGLLFTIYLKALEIFVIHAICRWCVVSAVLAAIIFLLCLPEWKRMRNGGAREGAPEATSETAPAT
ncbi:MAG: vitamin K epoxide reductase family protein [Gemmatimonadota bacterium]|nr:vitamin K epoxide reductase family protein [Gemmatimonadota bacterium]